MPNSTTVTVRVLAYGGKFIGQHVKFAKVAITDQQGNPLASGVCDQGLLPKTDGSGVVSLIMGQPYPWGYPVRADQATAFTVPLTITEPTVLTFTATSVADPRISVTVSRTVLPGVDLTGAMAVVLVLQGLLVDLTVPTAGEKIFAGTPTPITAQVRMMCGCLIENLFWPAANFSVYAQIADSQGNATTVPLAYDGTPSYFSAQFKFTKTGVYQISVTAVEMNGNCGASLAPVMVTAIQEV